MDWTFGEFAIATIGNSQYTITQGFHQPYAGTVGIAEAPTTTSVTWIWPNPAGNELNVGFNGPIKRNTLLRILGMDGKLIRSMPLQPGGINVSIPIVELSFGSYVLAIDTPDHPAQAHRFIKTP